MKELSKIFLNLDAHCAWMDFFIQYLKLYTEILLSTNF